MRALAFVFLAALVLSASGCVTPPPPKQDLEWGWRQEIDRRELDPSDPLYYSK